MIFSPSRVVLAAARKAKAPLAPAKKAAVVKKAAAVKKAVKNSVPVARNKPVKHSAVMVAPPCVAKPAEVFAAVPATTIVSAAVVPAADVVATMLDNTVMRVPMPAQSTLSTVAAPSAPRPAVEPLALKTGDRELTAVCITAALELNQNGLFF
jgi:hypothetical protein